MLEVFEDPGKGIVMNVTSTGPERTIAASAHSDALRRAWLWTGVAAAPILTWMALGPGEGGSVVHLVVALVGILVGMIAVARAFALTIRALKEGRALAIAPLLADCIVLFWGLAAIVGTLGRFYGWDA
jgi:hypothetical protein